MSPSTSFLVTDGYTTLMSIPASVNTHVTWYPGQVGGSPGSQLKPPRAIVAVVDGNTGHTGQVKVLKIPPGPLVPPVLQVLQVPKALLLVIAAVM